VTIILPQHYHAQRALEESRVVCISPEQAVRQDIRPLRIGILNVMPKAESYEYSILLPLGRSIIQIEPVWIRLNTHAYKTSNLAHISSLYVTYSEATAHAPLDGLILTGAPVEELPFESVRYWEELIEILGTARTQCASTLGICWGGLALAKMIGIEKNNFERKLFGAFLTRNTERHHPITGDTDDVFWCPQSRHSGINDETLEQQQLLGNVRLLAYEEQSGYTIFESADQRYLMHLGHPEYEPERLVLEYARDRSQGRDDVDPPANVNLDHPMNTWRSHRNEFFSQWIKFVYDHSCG
jgi:homoserine O-succinyltransferase/O-acetyltransferase